MPRIGAAARARGRRGRRRRLRHQGPGLPGGDPAGMDRTSRGHGGEMDREPLRAHAVRQPRTRPEREVQRCGAQGRARARPARDDLFEHRGLRDQALRSTSRPHGHRRARSWALRHSRLPVRLICGRDQQVPRRPLPRGWHGHGGARARKADGPDRGAAGAGSRGGASCQFRAPSADAVPECHRASLRVRRLRCRARDRAAKVRLSGRAQRSGQGARRGPPARDRHRLLRRVHRRGLVDVQASRHGGHPGHRHGTRVARR